MKKIALFLVNVACITSTVAPYISTAQVLVAEPTIASPEAARRPCIYIESNLGYGTKDKTTNGSVVNLQVFLNLYNYLKVEATGYFGPLTLQAVKNFQRDNAIPQTGFVGPLTRAQMKVLSCADDISPFPNANAEGIMTSVTTDKSVYVGQEKITITITATNTTTVVKTLSFTSGCETSYVVGEYDSAKDRICTLALSSLPLPPKASKSWTIVHDLAKQPLKAGTYTLEGRITGGYGSARTSITVTAGSIAITSPKLGETLPLGETKQITWIPSLGQTDPLALTYNPYTIEIFPAIRCFTTPCPDIVSKPYIIAVNVPTPSYMWNVGKIAGQIEKLQQGNYKIRICTLKGDVCSVSEEFIVK